MSKVKKVNHLDIIELNGSGKKKAHPSISDYYRAASTGNGERPIQYQRGLSNFSQLKLGDDRIYFKKSLSQVSYRLDADRAAKLALANTASTAKTLKQRREDYEEAESIVGTERILEMEETMRDKLLQRTKAGPFQLRKTFKYFDRDASGGIDFAEFQRAMELMGFQSSEIQQLALFARYDDTCTGEVDYNQFIGKVMESDFGAAHGSHAKRLNSMIKSAFSTDNRRRSICKDDDDSDLDEDEREMFRRTEVQKLFNNIDDDNSGYLDREEVESLLKTVGRDLSPSEIDQLFNMIDADGSRGIDFEEFYSWYRSAEESL